MPSDPRLFLVIAAGIVVAFLLQAFLVRISQGLKLPENALVPIWEALARWTGHIGSCIWKFRATLLRRGPEQDLGHDMQSIS
jgi:hypothetical protein